MEKNWKLQDAGIGGDTDHARRTPRATEAGDWHADSRGQGRYASGTLGASPGASHGGSGDDRVCSNAAFKDRISTPNGKSGALKDLVPSYLPAR